MVSSRKARFGVGPSARTAIALVLAGPAASAGEGFCPEPPDAGCAPVVSVEDLGCDAAGCDDLGCDATGEPCDPCSTRDTLIGDPHGSRSGLAESGVSVVLFDLTQVYRGVAAGGLEQTWDYGGHSDLVLNFEFAKMGGPKGSFLKVRGEGNFGEALGTETGACRRRRS